MPWLVSEYVCLGNTERAGLKVSFQAPKFKKDSVNRIKTNIINIAPNQLLFEACKYIKNDYSIYASVKIKKYIFFIKLAQEKLNRICVKIIKAKTS